MSTAPVAKQPPGTDRKVPASQPDVSAPEETPASSYALGSPAQTLLLQRRAGNDAVNRLRARRGEGGAPAQPPGTRPPRELHPVVQRDAEGSQDEDGGSAPDNATWTRVTRGQKFRWQGREWTAHIGIRPRNAAEAHNTDRSGIRGLRSTSRINARPSNDAPHVLEASTQAMEMQGSVPLGPLDVTLDVGLLEARLRSDQDFEITPLQVGISVTGVVGSSQQFAELLGYDIEPDIAVEVRGRISTSLGVEDARALRRYTRHMDDFTDAARRHDDARGRRRSIQRQIDAERRSRPRGYRAQQRRKRNLQRLYRQRQAANAELRTLQREMRRHSDSAARAASQVRSPIGQRVQQQMARRAITRIGARLLLRVIPFVNIACFAYDVVQAIQLIAALISGSARIAPGESGADGGTEAEGQTEGEQSDEGGGEPDSADGGGSGTDPAGGEGATDASGGEGGTEASGGEPVEGQPPTGGGGDAPAEGGMEHGEAEGLDLQVSGTTRQVLEILEGEQGIELDEAEVVRLDRTLPDALLPEELDALREAIRTSDPDDVDGLIDRVKGALVASWVGGDGEVVGTGAGAGDGSGPGAGEERGLGAGEERGLGAGEERGLGAGEERGSEAGGQGAGSADGQGPAAEGHGGDADRAPGPGGPDEDRGAGEEVLDTDEGPSISMLENPLATVQWSEDDGFHVHRGAEERIRSRTYIEDRGDGVFFVYEDVQIVGTREEELWGETITIVTLRVSGSVVDVPDGVTDLELGDQIDQTWYIAAQEGGWRQELQGAARASEALRGAVVGDGERLRLRDPGQRLDLGDVVLRLDSVETGYHHVGDDEVTYAGTVTAEVLDVAAANVAYHVRGLDGERWVEFHVGEVVALPIGVVEER